MARIGPGGPFLTDWGGQSDADPVPFAQPDWPNPVSRREVGGFTVAANLLLTALAVAAVTFRGPLVSAVPQGPWPQEHPTANLLLTTLGQPAPAPAPFAQFDWPVPAGPRSVISLRTWVEPTKLNLIGQDRFFAADGQGPSYDWPNPHHPRAFDGTVAVNLLQGTLGQEPAAAPFTPPLWELPHTPWRITSFHAPRPAPSNGVEAAAGTPVLPIEWTNPVRLRRSVALLTHTASPAVPVGETPPPGAFDWPLRVRTRSQQESTSLGGVLLDETAPFAVFDWQPLKRAPLDVTQLTWTVNLLQGTLDPGAPQLPSGRQTDWPLPVRARLTASPSWTQSLNIAEQPPAPTTGDTYYVVFARRLLRR